jgi:AcrR family transcriptional regulator
MAARRRQQRADVTRAKLVFLAARAFGRDGYDAMSIAPLLAEAEVARGGFYHHFASKRELFVEVVDGAERLFEVIGENFVRARRGRPPERQLVDLGWFIVSCFSLDGAGTRVLIADAPRLLSFEERTRHGRYPMLRDAVELVVGDAHGPEDWIDPLARQVLALCDECIRMCSSAEDPTRTHALLFQLFNRWIAGLVASLGRGDYASIMEIVDDDN